VQLPHPFPTATLQLPLCPATRSSPDALFFGGKRDRVSTCSPHWPQSSRLSFLSTEMKVLCHHIWLPFWVFMKTSLYTNTSRLGGKPSEPVCSDSSWLLWAAFLLSMGQDFPEWGSYHLLSDKLEIRVSMIPLEPITGGSTAVRWKSGIHELTSFPLQGHQRS
jgi:hypothetical protein